MQGIIDPVAKYAWGNDTGWINFNPTNGGVAVSDSGLSGDAWSANYGWINLAPADAGVKNDGVGNLSGYAWGDSIGWINFSGVKIDPVTGVFTGTATTTSLGDITFTCANCGVVTTWKSTVPVSVSVGGGSSMYMLSIDNMASSTPTTSVTLSLYGTMAYTMELSNTPDFANSTWVPYQASLPWVIGSATGTETVYAAFRAVSGATIGHANATIQYIPNGIGESASTTSSTTSTTTIAIPTSTNTTSSSEYLLSELQSLEAELAALESQASAASSSTPSSAGPTFSRDLYFGMTGNDVKVLQQYLIQENKGPAARALKVHGATKNFGPLTKAALIEFQKAVGITPASGYFGPITRGWINGHSE